MTLSHETLHFSLRGYFWLSNPLALSIFFYFFIFYFHFVVVEKGALHYWLLRLLLLLLPLLPSPLLLLLLHPGRISRGPYSAAPGLNLRREEAGSGAERRGAERLLDFPGRNIFQHLHPVARSLSLSHVFWIFLLRVVSTLAPEGIYLS